MRTSLTGVWVFRGRTGTQEMGLRGRSRETDPENAVRPVGPPRLHGDRRRMEGTVCPVEDSQNTPSLPPKIRISDHAVEWEMVNGLQFG